MKKNKGICRICGKVLAKCNHTGECFHHSMPSDWDPKGDAIRGIKFTSSICGNQAARTQAVENGGYAYE